MDIFPVIGRAFIGRALRLGALAAFLLPLAAPAQDAPRHLTVTGEAIVAAVPDMAQITLGATSAADTAPEAMAASSQAMDQVMDRLVALGIDPRDIQTSSLRLDQRWERSSVSGNQSPAGFEASNQITIRVRDLDRLGEVLAAVLEDGANRLGGLSFALQDPGPVEDAARRKAVQDALHKASLFAEVAKLRLGKVLSMTDAAAPMTAPHLRASPMAAEAAPVPVAAGEISFRGQVTMVFAIGE